MVVEKRRTSLVATELEKVIQIWESSTPIQLTNLTPDIVIASANFKSIPDIFDRLIVAEAVLMNAPVITRDPVISGSGLVKTIW